MPFYSSYVRLNGDDLTGPISKSQAKSAHTAPLAETHIYTLATQHVCRNSCIVPAAILKAMEVAADLFLPGDCRVEFVTDAI